MLVFDQVHGSGVLNNDEDGATWHDNGGVKTCHGVGTSATVQTGGCSRVGGEARRDRLYWRMRSTRTQRVRGGDKVMPVIE